ncbi:MAG TPA: hypothetical protein VGH47_04550 [Xanthobacteraceae bacterium]|jgi:hypothetical protein
MAKCDVGTFDLFGQVALKQTEQLNGFDQRPLNGFTKDGRYAEFIVCAYLTRMGYHATHVDTQGFDILLRHETRSYRIDVKSTSHVRRGTFKERAVWNIVNHTRPEPGRQRVHVRKGPLDADLLALFFRPLETVVFRAVDEEMKLRLLLPLALVRNSHDGRQVS